jgi:hypothetical protein
MRQAQEPSPVPHHPRSSQYREPTPAVAVSSGVEKREMERFEGMVPVLAVGDSVFAMAA